MILTVVSRMILMVMLRMTGYVINVLLLRLACKNLLRTGIRMWINALVIAFSIVIILFMRGLYAGLGHQMMTSLIHTEIAGGQFWAKGFDPLDPATFDNSFSPIPPSAKNVAKDGNICSILYSSGTLYYEGRIIPVTLRGIEPKQEVVDLPTKNLSSTRIDGSVPVLIGSRMAEAMKLKDDDTFVVKWRDSNGVFDGTDFTVVEKMDTVNPRVDSNVIWLDLSLLQKMLVTPKMASIMIVHQNTPASTFQRFPLNQWSWHSQSDLTRWVKNLVADKEKGGSVLFGLLLFLSCVGIFNSQTLAVFKKKEGNRYVNGPGYEETSYYGTLHVRRSAYSSACS